MESLTLAKEIAKAFESKLGADILVLKVDGLTTLADYFVIATGSSITQVRALADEAEDRVIKLGLPAPRFEGRGGDKWILLDCREVVAHVFTEEARGFYNLEKLWADAETVALD